jgi:hypothetical protein
MRLYILVVCIEPMHVLVEVTTDRLLLFQRCVTSRTSHESYKEYGRCTTMFVTRMFHDHGVTLVVVRLSVRYASVSIGSLPILVNATHHTSRGCSAARHWGCNRREAFALLPRLFQARVAATICGIVRFCMNQRDSFTSAFWLYRYPVRIQNRTRRGPSSLLLARVDLPPGIGQSLLAGCTCSHLSSF